MKILCSNRDKCPYTCTGKDDIRMGNCYNFHSTESHTCCYTNVYVEPVEISEYEVKLDENLFKF